MTFSGATYAAPITKYMKYNFFFVAIQSAGNSRSLHTTHQTLLIALIMEKHFQQSQTCLYTDISFNLLLFAKRNIPICCLSAQTIVITILLLASLCQGSTTGVWWSFILIFGKWMNEWILCHHFVAYKGRYKFFGGFQWLTFSLFAALHVYHLPMGVYCALNCTLVFKHQVFFWGFRCQIFLLKWHIKWLK